MTDPRKIWTDKAWAFVKGAALYAGAIGYWAQQDEPQPSGLIDFIDDQIHFYCTNHARHGRAGMAWAADADPLAITIGQTISRAAFHAGLRPRKRDVERACAKHGVRPDDLLHQHSEIAPAVAATLWP